jgi:hypothetical protein
VIYSVLGDLYQAEGRNAISGKWLQSRLNSLYVMLY